MKYSLRSLMIAVLVLPPLLAGAYFVSGGNVFTLLSLLLVVGLIFLWVWGGGQPGSSRYPPP